MPDLTQEGLAARGLRVKALEPLEAAIRAAAALRKDEEPK